MKGLEMTDAEFSKLPTKQQLTVLYRHLVAQRQIEEKNQVRDANIQTTFKWVIRGLVISDAAIWGLLAIILFK